VELFGRGSDDGDDVGNAAGAFAALLDGAIDLRGNNNAPRVLAEEGEDDLLDLPIGNDVALADEHAGNFATGPARISPIQKLIVNVRIVAPISPVEDSRK